MEDIKNLLQNDILREVEISTWQPVFEITDDLNKVIDEMLRPHEDYFLKLHDKVKEIIERETEYAKNNPNYRITFNDVCNWQKELFQHKKNIISNYYDELNCDLSIDGAMRLSSKIRMIENLPNLYINLGLRQTAGVKVNDWIPPHPMILENLKEMCFPISFSINGNIKINQHETEKVNDNDILFVLTQWYKIFQTIHFFEDLNGRIGGIVINILFYNLTGKYLIK